MPRRYTKSSPYWEQRKKAGWPGSASAALTDSLMAGAVGMPAPALIASPAGLSQAATDVPPSFDGQTHYTATAACGGGSVNETAVRDQCGPTLLDVDRYPNIRQGLMPFSTVEGNYSISPAISLTYQAYWNFAILRNTIDMMVDFSVGRIHVKTTNQRLKDFINTWFDAIGLNRLQAQHYLEYYRSGNVFYYKFNGKISPDGLNMLKESYSHNLWGEEAHAAGSGPKKTPIIPIRYIILNPMQVYLQRGASYTYGYVRMLSTYEIERLKNPQTEEDKQIFKSFPADIQRQIKQGGAWRWLFVPLDQNRLYYVFRRKQDYEPLAVPMAFSVLPDIEFKLNLRRIDAALAATTEQMFMLVTAGRPADQFNQTIGAATLQNLQTMFQNRTIGRVLISDYTTKAEWKIPDLKDILGPAKYERVDRDIKEGLQYMFFGDEKFANASIKVKIFIESLREGRRAFIDQFLMPEVKKVCEAMNFKNIPELEYEEVQIQDESLMNRLYVQLAQLGLMTPEETFTAMKTGMLPNGDESLDHQAQYKKDRAKGLYTPLMPAGGAQNGRPGGTGGTSAPRGVSSPIGQTAGRDMTLPAGGKYHFGALKVADNLFKMNEVKAAVEKGLRAKWGLETLNEAQASVATAMARNLVLNEPENLWLPSIDSYLESPKELVDEDLAADLAEIGSEFEVDSWTAAVLARSRVDGPTGQE